MLAESGGRRTEGKRPIIVIPGITGSQIISLETGKTVRFFFGFNRNERDNLRMPMSPILKQNTDTLVAIRRYSRRKTSGVPLTSLKDIRTASGKQISKEEVAKVIYADGSVTRRSFLPELKTAARKGKSVAQVIFPVKSTFFCSEHQKLLNNETIRTNYLTLLAAEAAASTVLK